jgi:CDGSH-type Zn-finger protein/uncharacterized Fe-S cluster protein YjdI
MADATTYDGKQVSIGFDGSKCIHSRHCVLTLPNVFQANVEGPWINPDNASVSDIVALARECPSGAITYERHDGSADEGAPLVNTVFIRENGPLAIHADLTIDGEDAGYRATLCRCGASKNKPICDGSHVDAKFEATGELKKKIFEPLESWDGTVTITSFPNGPVQVEGNLEICYGTGHTIEQTEKAVLCRCGESKNKPYCDGTHAKIGFTA